MYDKIGTDPADEKQLVEIRDFIKEAPKMEAELEAKQLDVKKHLAILEDYSFYHDDK
jgi:arginine utilization protein RocB